MEVTRIRELTQPFELSDITSVRGVEMEVTRIRELTQATLPMCPADFLGRNGSYPNKGIDT